MVKSDAIELACPSCQSMLEIDTGFSGGVCRCWNCGVLMTVPESTGDAAQRLTRAERPGEPRGGGRVGNGDAGARADRQDRPGQPGSVGKASGGGAGGGVKAAGVAGSGDEEIYVTESGEVVRVSKTKVVLSRRKRMGVRLAVVGGFVVVLSLLMGFTVFALWQVMVGSSVDIVAYEMETFGYDPSINPFTSERATYLGVPIVGRTVVAIDGSYYSRKWLDMAKDAAELAVEKSGKKSVQVLIWNDAGGLVFPKNIEPITRDDRKKLRTFLRDHQAIGQADVTPVVEKSLVGKPRQIVLVTGQYLGESDIESAVKMMNEKGEDVRVDVVMVSEDVPELIKTMVDKCGGVWLTLSTRQMRDWYGEYLDSQESDVE